MSGTSGTTSSTGSTDSAGATGLPAPMTPTDQGDGSDLKITAAVRRAVVAEKGLSAAAKNVKIITSGGRVTLRGTVKSDEEKSKLEAKAMATPGVTYVDNQLDVKK
jgi:osmotically-inducible protein OsmY